MYVIFFICKSDNNRCPVQRLKVIAFNQNKCNALNFRRPNLKSGVGKRVELSSAAVNLVLELKPHAPVAEWHCQT